MPLVQLGTRQMREDEIFLFTLDMGIEWLDGGVVASEEVGLA